MGDSFTASVGSGTLVLRSARVIAALRGTGDALEFSLEVLEGPLRGKEVTGLFYRSLGEPLEAGDVVAVNTVGLEMGLGTGGVVPILPSVSRGEAPENENHFVKLPYTPLQFPVPPPEQADDLYGVPLLVLPLHSHLVPACCAVADLRPGSRVSFVWQEGGALPVALSAVVRELKQKGLLHAVVSSGNCFGGDVEAPNVYSGLLAAAAVSDVVIAGIGPGVVGTGAPYGHGGMSAALALNAAYALAAAPVLAPRISSADPRGRHRGISHHTWAVLTAALGGCRVAIPESAGVPTEGLQERHSYIRVAYGAGGLEDRFGVTLRSMGRTYAEDPVFFDAAAATAALAVRERKEQG